VILRIPIVCSSVCFTSGLFRNAGLLFTLDQFNVETPTFHMHRAQIASMVTEKANLWIIQFYWARDPSQSSLVSPTMAPTFSNDSMSATLNFTPNSISTATIKLM
jgi:hypothetical protein